MRDEEAARTSVKAQEGIASPEADGIIPANTTFPRDRRIVP